MEVLITLCLLSFVRCIHAVFLFVVFSRLYFIWPVSYLCVKTSSPDLYVNVPDVKSDSKTISPVLLSVLYFIFNPPYNDSIYIKLSNIL